MGLEDLPSAARRFLGFENRSNAGWVLAGWVQPAIDANTIVVAIAGGGLVVADKLASDLGLPLECVTVNRVPIPGFPLADVAAVTGDGTDYVDRGAAARLRIAPDVARAAVEEERARAASRARYLGALIDDSLAGRSVLLVDEALDFGVIPIAAVLALRNSDPVRILVAAPVADRRVARAVAKHADDVITVLAPERTGSRTAWYRDLPPISDAEVGEMLALRSPVR